MRFIHSIFKINLDICNYIERFLPHARLNVTDFYTMVTSKFINKGNGCIILDIGTGKDCHYAKLKKNDSNKIVGVDISKEILSLNKDVDARVVCDASSKLPFKDEVIDIITTRAFLEHLEDVEGFIKETSRILKKGGISIRRNLPRVL